MAPKPLPRQLLVGTVACALWTSISPTVNALPQLRARALARPEDLSDVYDYVIIGGGTAGLTVADRLSEDKDTTVLVIESGALSSADSINLVRDQLGWFTDFSLFHLLETQPNRELNNGSMFAIAGNVVGGSSAVNGMQAPRGTRHEYDRWAEVYGPGGEGWGWEGMLPYFKKGTHRQTPSQASLDVMPYFKADPSYWGQEESTRVYTGWPTFQFPGVKYQIEALAQVPGVEFPEDAGAGEAGVYWYPSFFDGQGSFNRSYARTGHYDGLDRPNYHLLPNSIVTKIEINENNRATGVSFRDRYDNSSAPALTSVKANKEVILSAGTYHSPQILQLSGVGPRKLLEAAGIEVKVDLPGVGQNFHDHATVNITYTYNNFTLRPNRRDDMVGQNPEFLAWADELWAANHTGPWSRYLFNVGAWLPLTVMAPDEYERLSSLVSAQASNLTTVAALLPDGVDEADPTVIAGHAARLHALAASIRSPNAIFYQQGFTGDEPNFYITLENPLSAGSININTNNPSGPPVIDWRTYSNPVDFDIVVAMARFHRKLNLESPVYAPFQPFETGPGVEKAQTRDEWVAWIREQTQPSAMHPTGSCGMMPRELGGVVDAELRVHGVDGLRVVDASVMNMLVGVNICQTVYAVAEKGADLIKQAARDE
ncbi:choline dehydrogenase [Microdochium nivale]|nr:choline dehydrogenase [Microdochium nivale]